MSNITITNTVPPRMKDYYDIRIKESKFKVSTSKNAMFEWECEIVRPTIKSFGGEDYDLTSLKVRYYITAADKTIKQSNDALEKLGLEPFPDVIDPDDKDGHMRDMAKTHNGLIFGAILDSEEDKQTKPDGKGGWEPIYYPNTTKQIINGWKIVSQARDILQKSELKLDTTY